MASASTVIERLLDDHEVHKQMAAALEHLRDAAGAGTVAVKRVAGQQTEPKRHRGLLFMVALAAGIGAAMAASRRTAPQH
jgi:hypothetical protein